MRSKLMQLNKCLALFHRSIKAVGFRFLSRKLMLVLKLLPNQAISLFMYQSHAVCGICWKNLFMGPTREQILQSLRNTLYFLKQERLLLPHSDSNNLTISQFATSVSYRLILCLLLPLYFPKCKKEREQYS